MFIHTDVAQLLCIRRKINFAVAGHFCCVSLSDTLDRTYADDLIAFTHYRQDSGMREVPLHGVNIDCLARFYEGKAHFDIRIAQICGAAGSDFVVSIFLSRFVRLEIHNGRVTLQFCE